jgi:hypothetical protein
LCIQPESQDLSNLISFPESKPARYSSKLLIEKEVVDYPPIEASQECFTPGMRFLKNGDNSLIFVRAKILIFASAKFRRRDVATTIAGLLRLKPLPQGHTKQSEPGKARITGGRSRSAGNAMRRW